jgi:hypothetical protein
MTDATVSTATGVVVDIEATIKAEVAKAVAAVKAEESKAVTWVKTMVATYWPHVTLAGAGYAAAAFGVVEKVMKFL